MRELVKLSDEQIEHAFEPWIGLVVDDVVWTRDTISDFLTARANYYSQGKVEEHTDQRLVITNAQTTKGTPRRDICVVDFGEVRGAGTF